MTHDHIAPPPGTPNLWPGDTEQLARLTQIALSTVRVHGYRPATAPLYEPVQLYTRLYGDDIHARLATFTTDQEYALRPDLTGGLCRMLGEQLGPEGALPTPLRLFSAGRAFRYERVRPLRRREFHQAGIERFGGPRGAPAGGDLEVLSLLRLTLQAVGLPGGLLRVGHAELRPRLLDALGVDEARQARIGRLLDLLSRHRMVFDPPRTGADRPLGDCDGTRAPDRHPDAPHVVTELRRALLRITPDAPEPSNAEELLEALEAAFHREAKAGRLKDAQREALMGLTWSAASLSELADTVRPLLPETDTVLPEALGHIDDCLADLEPLVLRFSLGMVRGLGYYTGITFEVDAPVLGPDVCQIAGGGRYDGVVAALGGPHVPAAGFALGIERLQKALQLLQGPDIELKLTPPEPLLLCFSEHPEDRDMIASLAHRIKAEGACVAIHPEPVDGASHNTFLKAIEGLPGSPYRYVLLAEHGELHLASLGDDGGSEHTDLETLLLMFTQHHP